MTETLQQSDEITLDWREFLANRPPGTRAAIDRAAFKTPSINNSITVATPELRLFCDGECQSVSHCKGATKVNGRLFGGTPRETFPPAPLNTDAMPFDAQVRYVCEKCGRIAKSYSLRFWKIAPSPDHAGLAEVEKLSEWPAYSPRTPSKVLNLVGPDRDLYLKGRRAETEGLGIGAFAYYRRIIENQKSRLLDEIIRVARHLGTTDDAIAALEDAKLEIQFSKAVESVKHAIPEPLYIKTHNPLTLLHGALSEGIHERSDEECLIAANDIRLILFEFAERLTEAMKEQRELNSAIDRLVNRNRCAT